MKFVKVMKRHFAARRSDVPAIRQVGAFSKRASADPKPVCSGNCVACEMPEEVGE